MFDVHKFVFFPSDTEYVRQVKNEHYIVSWTKMLNKTIAMLENLL